MTDEFTINYGVDESEEEVLEYLKHGVYESEEQVLQYFSDEAIAQGRIPPPGLRPARKVELKLMEEINSTVLARLLKYHNSNNGGLTKLKVDNVELVGPFFDELYQEFGQLRALEEISIDGVFPYDQFIRQVLVKLYQEFAIKEFSIEAIFKKFGIDGVLEIGMDGIDQLRRQVKLPSLSTVALFGDNGDGSDDSRPSLSALTLLIENAPSLYILHVDYAKHDNTDEILAFWKAVGNSKLISLNHRCKQNTACDDSHSEGIATMLKTKSMLGVLKWNIPVAKIGSIYEGLAKNSKLHYLHLENFETNPSFECFIEELNQLGNVLEFHNHTLTLFSRGESEWSRLEQYKESIATQQDVGVQEEMNEKVAAFEQASKKVSFYFDLNRIGTKKLLLGVSKDEWVKAISDQADNTAVVFFFLRADPSKFF